MRESETFFHQIEWPGPGARVTGPVVWVRGWVIGKPGYDFVDIRIVSSAGIHLGVLGLPRMDLAQHFKSARSWLPAEFVVGVPASANRAEQYSIEAMDDSGNWHPLEQLSIQVATDGAPSPRIEGALVTGPDGSSTRRTPHLPYHGHLDEPGSTAPIRFGRVALFGWLLHETQPLRSVFATIDGLVFNHLEFGLTDESLAAKLPRLKSAGHARLRGEVDLPPTIFKAGCLRVYAELADGSVALCFAQRIAGQASTVITGTKTPAAPAIQVKKPVELPSGRPRRLLIATKTLQPDEATLRALDVARHLMASVRWAVRLVVSEDGPLHDAFETAGCSVQIVDPAGYFAAKDDTSTHAALATLGRQIWWAHLNAVAIFGSDSAWAERLAQQKKLPVITDPADELLWFSAEPIFAFDAQAPMSAPIRGQAIHGANTMLHAADQLARRHRKALGSQKILLTDVRDSGDERLFQNDLSFSTDPILAIALPSRRVAAVVCPAFGDHPHRALVSAAAIDVPVITTPSPALSAAFGPNEMQFVAPGNPLALAHAIADVVANPAAAERRAAAAARIALANFAPARQLARWQELLESVVAS
jgi:hypothetical protein